MTIRIDTLRNRIAATIDLLRLLEVDCEDLHVLAYERPTAVGEHTRSTNHDWALDNHGSLRARDAYRTIAHALVNAIDGTPAHCDDPRRCDHQGHWDGLVIAAHNALALLRNGSSTGLRTRRTITSLEHADLLAAKARRTVRGDYSPVARLPQPDASIAVAAARKAEKAARSEADKLRRRLAKIDPGWLDQHDRAKDQSRA